VIFDVSISYEAASNYWLILCEIHSHQLLSTDLKIRVIDEKDIAKATELTRIAFGTFLGLPDPSKMFEDREIIRNRWIVDPKATLGAYLNGEIAGINVLTRWGTVGLFGPLAVRVDLWDTGVAKNLMAATMDVFANWGTTFQGLFTFAHSPKHVGLYHKFGFNARFLTAVMTKDVVPDNNVVDFITFSGSSDLLRKAKEITNELYKGMDLSSEIAITLSRKLGDTIFLHESSRITGFAICHVGTGTEAGSGNCYVKFGAVRPNSKASFEKLLDAVSSYAVKNGAKKVEAGVNLAREQAFESMLKKGFRTEFQGVAMHRPNEPGYSKPDVYAIDDWR
jgi:predicted N-acetyltransferase YhbS